MIRPKFHVENGKKLVNFDFEHPKLGKLFLKSQLTSIYMDKYKTTIHDEKQQYLGAESYNFNPSSIFGFDIRVMPEFRKKGLNLGEILRLSSIMTMFENGMDRIDIFSKNSAIFFHSKYKFKPDLKHFDERDYALSSMAKINKKGFEDVRNDSIELTKKVLSAKDAKELRSLRDDTSNVVARCIDKVENIRQKEPMENPFERGIYMTLTKDNVIKSADYFNNLFKKHNIDYEI